MKLAQINLTRGIFIPGLGQVMKLENVELASASTLDDRAAGLLITTPTAKVLIPWERIESVVTEWIKVAVNPPVPPPPTAKEMFEVGAVPLPQGKYREEPTAEVKDAIVKAVTQTATMGGTPVVVAGPLGPGIAEQLSSAAQAASQGNLSPEERKANERVQAAQQVQGPQAAAALQPGPPPKKGGRR